MHRIAQLFLCLALAGCGFSLAQAQSILDTVTNSPLYEPTRDCVAAGIKGADGAKAKALDVGRCLAGLAAEPEPSPVQLEQIGERAIALDHQVSETMVAIESGSGEADALARGCQVLEAELAGSLAP